MEGKVNKCHKKSYKEALTGKISVECETESVEYPSLISTGAEDWRPPSLLSLGPREEAHEVRPTVSLKAFSSQKRRNKTFQLRPVQSLLFLPAVSQVKEILSKNNSDFNRN